MASSKNKRLKRTRIPSDDELLDMLKREDYYIILKILAHPEDKRGIRWNTMRTKWSILSQFDKL